MYTINEWEEQRDMSCCQPCEICGRIASWKNGENYQWTYFGDSTMADPPDSVIAHKLCFEKDPPEESICWQKPVQINPRNL